MAKALNYYQDKKSKRATEDRVCAIQDALHKRKRPIGVRQKRLIPMLKRVLADPSYKFSYYDTRFLLDMQKYATKKALTKRQLDHAFYTLYVNGVTPEKE